MARGLSVLAVVFVHLWFFQVTPALGGHFAERPLLHVLNLINDIVLADLRMPLLLFISGWLAGTKITAGLGSPRTRLSIATNAYLFVVWTLIYFALEKLVAPGTRETLTLYADTLPDLARSLLVPDLGPLWFVYALAILTTLLALARHLPTWVIVAAALATGWAVSPIMHSEGVPAAMRVPHLAIFFVAGVLIGPRVPSWLTSVRFVLVSALIAALSLPAAHLIPVALRYPFSVVESLAGCMLALGLARLLAHWDVARAPLAWVGRRTLGVYVLHWPMVGALVLASHRHPALFGAIRDSDTAVATYVLVATALIAALSVLIEIALRRVGAGFLFRAPAPLERAVTR